MKFIIMMIGKIKISLPQNAFRVTHFEDLQSHFDIEVYIDLISKFQSEKTVYYRLFFKVVR